MLESSRQTVSAPLCTNRDILGPSVHTRHKTTESAHGKPILLKPLSKVDVLGSGGVANSWRRLKPDIFLDSCGQGLSKSSEVYLTSMGFVDNYLSSIYKTSFFKSDTTSVSNLMCDNRPPPSSKNPHFQNEEKCTTFLVEMSFICIRMKNHFRIKGLALNLVSIQRPAETRKLLIKDIKDTFLLIRLECCNGLQLSHCECLKS